MRNEVQTPYEELFHLFRAVKEEEANEMVRRIRAGEDVSDMIRLVNDGNLLIQTHLVPETGRRYQFPHLPKVPEYLRSAYNPYFNILMAALEEPNRREAPKMELITNHRSQYAILYQAAEIFDPHLWNIKASRWTEVIQDDYFISRLLNSYFLHQYPIFLGFQKDYFLEDMAAGRDEFCTPLRVNTLCAAGCHTYTGVPDRAQFWNPSTLT